ncbi:hypothetical protein AAHC03_09665 [Spirometra sp. Aus1]
MRSLGAVVCVLAVLWSPSVSLDRRLATYNYLNCGNATSCQEFPASVEEQLHILSKPIRVYDREIEQIKIYSNGFIVLGNHSTMVPRLYPARTGETGQRLGSLDGDFIGVFTTVNHCSPNGRILIREVNAGEIKAGSCAERHIQRLVHAIRAAYADDQKFDPSYILSITWSDMGCMTGEDPKRNTFSLTLLSDGSKTYAVFQYIAIEWTSDHSSSNLPPEAGIFIRNLETPQLPISDMPTAPQGWTEETNVAVEGEWILALRQAALNTDNRYQSRIRTEAEEFLASVGSICNGSDSNYTVWVPEHEETRSPRESVTEDNQMDETATKALVEDKVIHEKGRQPNEAPQLGDEDQRSALQCSRGNCNGSVTDCINLDGAQCCVCPFGYYGGGSEPCRKIKSERPFRIYLSGMMNVTFRDSPVSYRLPVFMDAAIRSSGEVLTQSGVHELPKSEDNGSLAFMSILSPLFHLLNSFVSTPPPNCEVPSPSPTMNIFSLTGGFEKSFELTLRATAGQYGGLLVRGVLQRETTGEEYTRGSLQLEVFAESSFQRLTEKCTEREGADQASEPIHYVSYEKTAVGRVSFSRQIAAFDCGEGKSLEVDWSAEGTGENGCLLGQNKLWPMNKKLYVRLSDQGYCNADCRSERGCSFYCLDLPSLYTTNHGACDCVKCERPGEVCVAEGRSYVCACPDGYQRAENGGCIERSDATRYDTKDICDLPLETGPCKAVLRRFGYSQKDRRCIEFVYGGCQGNANNFASLEVCQARCGKVVSADRCRDVRCGKNARCVDGRCMCEEGYEGEAERECKPKESGVGSRSLCELPLETGPCRAYVRRYGYSPQSRRCQIFTYGGCGGNANNFESEQECMARCGDGVIDPCRDVRCGPNARCEAGRCVCERGYESGSDGECRRMESGVGSRSLCELPLETGPCRAYVRRYGYSPQSRRCQIFTYGGCGGNANNFESEQECMARCGDGVIDPCRDVRCGPNARCEAGRCVCERGYESGSDGECRRMESGVGSRSLCELPLETGPCRAYVRRYGYSPQSRRCQIFTYGGCGGNANNFESEQECMARCGDGVIDPCRDVRCGPNARCEAGRCVCERGYESGSDGECRRMESGVGSRSLCELPLETGPCRAYVRRYGYSPQSRRCQIFTYGGCGGNANNFESEQECMARCGDGVIDPCRDVRCGPNARCEAGRCVCERGYESGSDGECRRMESDPCRDVRCGPNSRCEAGRCVCERGYEGDAETGCRPIESVRSTRNLCELPFETGRCRAYIRRFGFNPRTGRCEAFTYGGCEGNENNFETEQECTARCGSTASASVNNSLCDLPLDPGPCAAYVPRYGFNPHTKRCEAFTYGGCEGNMNNFETEQECMNRCGLVTSDTCTTRRCGPNAYCRDGVCICNGGFTGDPYSGCQRLSDGCGNVECVANAHCEDGQCVCDAGYSGDGFVRCNYRGSCSQVNCGTNAYCRDGECFCESGFKGDPRRYCEPIEAVDCGERRCGINAHCFRGRCECLEGHTGDPYRQCNRAEPEKCGAVVCHEKAKCHDGQCFCDYGYVGDGVTTCVRREDDLCRRVTCAANAVCDAGLCQCLPGYSGDGFSKCVEAPVDPDLCGGKYCGTNAKCQNDRCVCLPGYTGDANDACVPEVPLPDTCANIQCGSNAYCKDAVCICFQGFTGDPNLACQPIYDTSCIGVSCGVNAYCSRGRCACPENYTGDPNSYCYSAALPQLYDMCSTMMCHENATCSAGRCRCNHGFEGDGFIDCWKKDPVNVCDCAGAPPSIAGCSNGRCRCYPGFKARAQDGRCDECRAHSDCASNARCDYDYDVQLYRCQCEKDFIGDGAIACIPGAEANGTQTAQCRVPCHNFGSCDETSGRCRCRSGFKGNGYTYCDFDCSQCLQEATCAPDLNKCVCPPGYTGDGIKFCRVSQVQGRLTLKIEKDGDVLRMYEGSGPIELYCKLTGEVTNVAVRWLTPSDVGHQTQTIMSDGKQVRLTITEPKVSHSGSYVCQAGGVADSINVVIERRPMDKKTHFFLSSDNGILTVQSSDEPTAVAAIWHIAEDNKHKQVALALDCNADRLIYTSNSGHALRWGNASAAQLEAKPTLVLEDAFSKFAWIAVDPTSGNIFAVDAEQKRIIVTNPNQPRRTYTFSRPAGQSNNDNIQIAGIAVHPRLSLVYWGQSTPGSSPEYSIQVARMSDGFTTELVALDGSPIALNLATSPDMTASSTAGRICWFQRRSIPPFPRTEMRCAQLEPDGLAVRQGRLMKEFSPTEEPSNGLIQEDDAILWTPLYKRMYRSLNPSKTVFVKGVCCSNGFQSIAAHKICRNSYTNTCSFDNGRCRFFCMPGGLTSSRTCKCPDDQPTCVPELS